MLAPPISERRVTEAAGRAGDAKSDSVEMVGWSAMEISSLAGESRQGRIAPEPSTLLRPVLDAKSFHREEAERD
jgi:hypothetical protein